MQLIYDNEADALAVKLAEGVVERTIEIDSGTLVDVEASGRVLTLEVIHPARRWPLDEVLARFPLTPDDAAVLRAIWEGDTSVELSEPAPLAVR
jgi:uncharacterized protein YuzE